MAAPPDDTDRGETPTPLTTQANLGGLVRETLVTSTARQSLGGLVREALVTATARQGLGGLVREALVGPPATGLPLTGAIGAQSLVAIATVAATPLALSGQISTGAQAGADFPGPTASKLVSFAVLEVVGENLSKLVSYVVLEASFTARITTTSGARLAPTLPVTGKIESAARAALTVTLPLAGRIGTQSQAAGGNNLLVSGRIGSAARGAIPGLIWVTGRIKAQSQGRLIPILPLSGCITSAARLLGGNQITFGSRIGSAARARFAPGVPLTPSRILCTARAALSPELHLPAGRIGCASFLRLAQLPNKRLLSVSKLVGAAVITQIGPGEGGGPPDGGSGGGGLKDVIIVSKLMGAAVTAVTPLTEGPIGMFPPIPIGFPIRKSIKFATQIQTVKNSNRTSRLPQQLLPFWEFELLSLEVLRDQGWNAQPAGPMAGFTEFQELCGLFLQMNGQWGLFYFDDASDNSRKGQLIGVTDGTSTDYTVVRTWGYGPTAFVEPVGGVNSMDAVYLQGVLQDPSTWSVAGNVLTFPNAPPADWVITADFSFFYLCRFTEDTHPFEQFFKGFWSANGLKFRSVLRPI